MFNDHLILLFGYDVEVTHSDNTTFFEITLHIANPLFWVQNESSYFSIQEQIMSYLWRVLTTIQVSLITYPQFFSENDSSNIDSIVDQIENDLQAFTAALDLPYTRPDMSPKSVLLMEYSYTQFIKRYVQEVRRACRNHVNFVFL